MSIAILENTKRYGERLTTFISRQEHSPFMVSLYLEHPIDCGKLQDIDVIVMTSSLFEVYKTTIDKERLMILDEDGKSEKKGSLSVYKYQSAHVIYKSLLEFCVDKSGKKLIGNGQHNRQVFIGIYTPIRDEKVSESIIAMCKHMGANHKVLYMNFEVISLFEDMMEQSDKQEGLSDLIYYIKGRNGSLGARLDMICEKAEFDYLLPAQLPTELGELSNEDWQFYFESMKNETDYEEIILDFGSMVAPNIVLEYCHQWLAVSEEGAWQGRLIERFYEITKRLLYRNDNLNIQQMNLDEVRRWGE